MSEHQSLKNRLETIITFEPMPYEVDFTGFLSNTIAVQWMEKLRVKMMRMHLGGINTAARENLSVICSTRIDYRHPVRYGDVLAGKVWVHALMKARWEVAFSFTCADKRSPAIEGIQAGVFIDAISFRPVRIPNLIIEACL